MKAAAIIVLLVAVLAILTQSRRHYWGNDNGSMDSPLHRLIKSNAKLHNPDSNAKSSYLLAMNRREKGGLLTLHGLWPQWAQACVEAGPFKIRNLDPIIDEMNKYWPSFNRPDYASFWEHEWDKHLTCESSYLNRTGNPQSQLQIFQHSLDLLHEMTPHCDQPDLLDCRCDLDQNYKLVGCRQK